MHVVWNKQSLRLHIYFTCKKRFTLILYSMLAISMGPRMIMIELYTVNDDEWMNEWMNEVFICL